MTQREPAARAGTGQAAISERVALAPSLARLEELVALTGHRLSLAVVERPVLVDRELLADDPRMFAEERLELAALLSQPAFELAEARRRLGGGARHVRATKDTDIVVRARTPRTSTGSPRSSTACRPDLWEWPARVPGGSGEANPPVPERVADLLSRMTLAEEVCAAAGAWSSPCQAVR